jgi:hypothetical protein
MEHGRKRWLGVVTAATVLGSGLASISSPDDVRVLSTYHLTPGGPLATSPSPASRLASASGSSIEDSGSRSVSYGVSSGSVIARSFHALSAITEASA